jgi:hypothetical protein
MSFIPLLLHPHGCLRASALSEVEVFLVKLQPGRFLASQPVHRASKHCPYGTTAMAAPDATGSALNAALHVLLTRDLAVIRSSLPTPDRFPAQRRPAVCILLTLCPNPHLSQSRTISFISFPCKGALLQALGCKSDSNLREKAHLYYAFPYACSKFISQM